nr:MAG TPA: hypothetical protein [Caudoviricetes sp.]
MNISLLAMKSQIGMLINLFLLKLLLMKMILKRFVSFGKLV